MSRESTARVAGQARRRVPDQPGRAARPVRRVGDRELERRRLGTVHAPGAVARSAATGSASCRRSRRRRPAPSRHRDLLLEATGEDADALVHGLLIRFCAAFLDQGLAAWPLPRRDEGFFRAFCTLYRQPGGPPDRWMRGPGRGAGPAGGRGDRPAGVDPRVARRPGGRPRTSGSPSSRRRSWPCAAGPGWSGRSRSGATASSTRCPRGSLVEFLAVRLLLDRFALAYTAREALGYTGPLAGLRDALRRGVTPGRRASSSAPSSVFQLAQVVGLSPDLLHRLSRPEWATDARGDRVLHGPGAPARLPPGLRTAVLHADARRHRPARPEAGGAARARRDSRPSSASTSARNRSAATWRSWPPTPRPSARPASSRSPCTSGAPPTPTSSPLCPAVIRPQHWVVERVVDSLEEDNRRRARTRRILGMASHRIHTGSRSLTQRRAPGGASACWPRSRWSPARSSRA